MRTGTAHPTTPGHPRRAGVGIFALTALAFLSAAAPLDGQQAIPAAQPEPPRAALARVATGSVLGSVLGAAAGTLAGAALGSLDTTDDEFISSAEAFGALGLAVGTTVGAAVGARLGATVEGARPAFGRVLVFSAGGAVLGGLLWNRVGETFERPESMTSWYAGAAVAVLTHWGITTLGAQRSPRARPVPVPAPGDPDA